MESGEAKQCQCCNCGGNCLCKECPCFLRGQYCSPNCKCPNCHNKPEFEAERLEVFTKILEIDPLAFTANNPLDPEEISAITNFAMLTESVDTETFRMKKQEDNTLNKLTWPEILQLSVVTTLQVANEALKKSTDPKSFNEEVENSIATEFQDILTKVHDSVNQ